MGFKYFNDTITISFMDIRGMSIFHKDRDYSQFTYIRFYQCNIHDLELLERFRKSHNIDLHDCYFKDIQSAKEMQPKKRDLVDACINPIPYSQMDKITIRSEQNKPFTIEDHGGSVEMDGDFIFDISSIKSFNCVELDGKFYPLSHLKGKRIGSLRLFNNVKMDIPIEDIIGIRFLRITNSKEVYINFQNLQYLHTFMFDGGGSFNVENIGWCKDTLEVLTIDNCTEGEKIQVKDILNFPNIRSVETDVMDLSVSEIIRYPKDYPSVPKIIEGKEYKLIVKNPTLFNEKIDEIVSSRISNSIKDNRNDSCKNSEFYEKWNISNGGYQEVIGAKVNYTKKEKSITKNDVQFTNPISKETYETMDDNLLIREIFKAVCSVGNPRLIARRNKSFFVHGDEIHESSLSKEIKYICIIRNQESNFSLNEKLNEVSDMVRYIIAVDHNFSQEQIDIISNMKNLEVVFLMNRGKYKFFLRKDWLDNYHINGTTFDLPEFTNVATKLI